MRRPDVLSMPRPTLRLFLGIWLLYLLFLNPVPQSMALNILDLATSLVDHHSITLDGWHGMDTAVRDGRTLSGMPPGASVPAALLYALLSPLIHLFPKDQELTFLNIAAIAFLSAPAAAATAVVFFRALDFSPASPAARLFLTLLLAFGTMQFGYATGYFKNTFAVLFLFAGFTLLRDGHRTHHLSPLRAAAAGCLMGAAISFDYPSLLGALLVGIYLGAISRSPRHLLVFSLASLLTLLPLFSYHAAAFGSPFSTSYTFRIAAQDNTWGSPHLGNVLLLFFSPSFGLLPYSPILCLSLFNLGKALSARRDLPENLTIAALTVLVPAAFSGWPVIAPHDASLTSRHLLVLVPFLLLPLAYDLPSLPRRVLYPAAVLSLLFSVLGAQAGLIPSGTVPLVYSLKVAVTSLAAGPLFSDYLPRVIGMEVFHTAGARYELSPAKLLTTLSPSQLFPLLGGQLAWKLLSLSCTAVVGWTVWVMWGRPPLSAGGGT